MLISNDETGELLLDLDSIGDVRKGFSKASDDQIEQYKAEKVSQKIQLLRPRVEKLISSGFTEDQVRALCFGHPEEYINEILNTQG